MITTWSASPSGSRRNESQCCSGWDSAIEAGAPFGLGLECGSKPELQAVLGTIVAAFVILAAYLVLVGRALRIGFAGQDDFGKLLASGLGFAIALQVFIVVGGVTLVIPLTGLTAPFLAAGGSSLVSNWIIVAVLLLISYRARMPQAATG